MSVSTRPSYPQIASSGSLLRPNEFYKRDVKIWRRGRDSGTPPDKTMTGAELMYEFTMASKRNLFSFRNDQLVVMAREAKIQEGKSEEARMGTVPLIEPCVIARGSQPRTRNPRHHSTRKFR